jgi:hypothetical protein
MRLRLPLPNSLVAERLDAEAFVARLETVTAKVRRRVIKLECLQSYQEAGNPSYEAFIAGDMQRAIQLAQETHRGDERFYRMLRSNGARMLRLRLVEFPLSKYLLWEFEHYEVVRRMGEDVRIVEQAAAAGGTGPGPRLQDLCCSTGTSP